LTGSRYGIVVLIGDITMVHNSGRVVL
jgi:hypothetical protein